MIDLINELSGLQNKMNDNLTTQECFTDAIRSQRFIVGSVSSEGLMSFNPNPTVHLNSFDARTECKRLAKLYPTKMYIFVQFKGAEMVPSVTTISI